MNGCQLAGLIAWAAPPMNSSTTATFTKTMTLLTFADSLMPMTSSVVMIAMMMTAGRLKTAVMVDPSPRVTAVPRAADSAGGTVIPLSVRDETTHPDHPVAAVMGAHRRRSHRVQPTFQRAVSSL